MAKVSGGYQLGLSWVYCENGGIPRRAIPAGDGIYIARSQIQSDVVPGKAVQRYGTGYFPWGGREHESKSYEVLCDSSLPGTSSCYEWEHCYGGNVPKSAIVGGRTSGGDALYVARSKINGECVIGKVHEGHDTGYFPYGGNEQSEDNYEVLVFKE